MNFKQIMYLDTYLHPCRPLYTVLPGSSVVPSLSNEANDIQHVALLSKELRVFWIGLRDMSLFPVVKSLFEICCQESGTECAHT